MAHKFPIGIQTFRRIREEGYVYVDKTDLVYELVHGSVFNFLSRPRRFGKSLLVSTLHAYFDGRKDLFEGLAIETLETEWIKRPVFHLDLSGANYSRPEALEVLLDVQLDQWEKEYGSSPNEKTLEARFKGVIGRAKEKTGQQVALLIDEYEKPILDTIGKPELQAIYREMLHGFYGCIKPSEEYFKFVLLTGVTKIGKLSVFSALNNITEMTFDSRYASICGITEKQVHAYFDEDIRRMADVNDITFEEMCERLKIQYDGYHFKRNSEPIYNPFSFLIALDKCEIGNYWFATGTPTYLVELFKSHNYEIGNLSMASYDEAQLNEIDSFNDDVIPLLYQSGYLTLKAYEARFDTYKLGFPNKEVEKGMLDFFIPFYSKASSSSQFNVIAFVKDIEAGTIDAFLTRLFSLMADTPYEIERDLEVHVQNFCFILFKLLGYYVQAEYRTNIGRIDLIFKTDQFVYIIEFKKGRSAKEALKQIKNNGYDAPFASDPRKKFLIGINYSLKARGMGKYALEVQ